MVILLSARGVMRICLIFSMARKQYIDALQSADKGNYVKLIAFARS